MKHFVLGIALVVCGAIVSAQNADPEGPRRVTQDPRRVTQGPRRVTQGPRRTGDGATPLHWAVYWDDLPAVDRLIAAGANVRVGNREGVTPLAMACLYGNLPIVDRLLKRFQ